MPCPFCENVSAVSTTYPVNKFNGKEFHYVRCTACRLVYLDPFPTGDDYVAMYPTTYQSNTVQTDIQPDVYKKMPGLRFSYGYQFELIRKQPAFADTASAVALAKVDSRDLSILDYGCGMGHFLANASAKGFHCDGAEFNPDYIKLLKQSFPGSGFYTIGEVLEGRIQRQYDVIRLSNVLEHLDRPSAILARLSAWLKPGGIFLIEGPIEENFCLATFFKKLYFRLDHWRRPNRVVNVPPYHIFFSTAKNQREFFKRCHLEETHFATSESPWPLPHNFKEAKGVIQGIAVVVARISMFFTRILPGHAGNTFIYAGKVKSEPTRS